MARSTLFALIAILVSTACPAAEWAVKDFAFRRAVVLAEVPPGAPAAHLRFSTLGATRPDLFDLRVTNDAGQPVNFEVLRNGPGDQAEILFDCTNAKTNSVFYVYFGNAKAAAPKEWTARAGVVLEVRAKGPGDGESWANYKKMFDASTEVTGKILRPKIFDGYNPMGPNLNFVTYYRAYFLAPGAGNYKFATTSDDASFMFVDGTMVSQAPGVHGADPNAFQKNAGMQSLVAGVHKMEYYHYQGEGDMATVAAWQPPGEKFMRMMENNHFVPVVKAVVQNLERADKAPALDFHWGPMDHLLVENRYFIKYLFKARAADSIPAGNVLWDFGDGETITDTLENARRGIEHIFLHPGNFTVTLKMEKEASPPPVIQKVAVEPVWAQREEFDDGRWNQYRKLILDRFTASPPPGPDLPALLLYARTFKEKDLLDRIAQQAWKIQPPVPDADRAEFFLYLGLELQAEPRDYDLAGRAFLEAIKAPSDKILQDRARLHRAGFLIHVLGQCAEALNILKAMDGAGLNPNEASLRRIYTADALAGTGQREEAIKQYEALGNVVPMTNREYVVSRRSRILSIEHWIKNKEYEAALDELGKIEWETPQERMADDTGLLKARCYLGQERYLRAISLMDRLLKIIPTSPKAPEMLLVLIKAYKGLNQPEQVEATFAKLKKEFPYSAETALAIPLVKN